MYIRVDSNNNIIEYPFNPEKIRLENPGTSFPTIISDETLITFGVYSVGYATPVFDTITQVAEEGIPVLLDNVWTQTWIVRDKTAEEIAQWQHIFQQEIVRQVQNRLDAFAQSRNYDGILSACSYATSSNPTFKAEAEYCVTQRDATWSALYTLLAEVQAGTRAVPTSYADIEPELPILEWPN